MIIPEIENFVNAFLLIIIIWILTFHILHLMRKVNTTFLYVHFGMLMTLVFIPVSSMFADNFPGSPLFSLILHLNVFFIGTFLLVEWQYVSGHQGLIHCTLTRRERDESLRRILSLILAAVIGGFLALSEHEGTRFVYLLVLLFLLIDSLVISRRKIRRDRILKISGPECTKEPEITHEPAITVRNSPKAGKPSAVQGPVELGMLEILMNGVFAFTMTLIVKNIPLPRVTDSQNIELMARFFIRIAIDTIEFIVVFIILALFWLLAFQLLRWMKTVDMTFVYLALAELLVIVFIPITSSLFTFFSEQTHISVVFTFNVLICGLILIIQWYHLRAETNLLHEEAAEEIKMAGRVSWDDAIISAIKNREKKDSFIGIRSSLFILPVASLFWLFLNIYGMPFSLAPALMGVCYLIFRSRA